MSNNHKHRFRIIDWAFNEMNFGHFKSFQDAWGFLYGKFESDEDLGEYEVVPVKECLDLKCVSDC